MTPWMGRTAPSKAHNRAHWLFPIMELSGRSQFEVTPLHPCEVSQRHVLSIKSGCGTLKYKRQLKKKKMYVSINSLHCSKMATSSQKVTVKVKKG